MLIDLFEIWLPLISINLLSGVKQTNEPHSEKENVDIYSDTAKFQSSAPNAGEMADI